MGIFDELLLESTPAKDYAHAGRKAGRDALRNGPPDGPEFRRIRALPTRDWRTAYDVPELVDRYSRELSLTGSGRLLPMQAVGLHELRVFRRLYVVAGLGTGKTLLSALAPTILGFTGAETVFIPPHPLVKQTRDALTELSSEWRVASPENVLSAKLFSNAEYASYLLDLKPRVVILDESQTFGNPGSGRSARLQQYLDLYPGTHVITLTATPGDSSLASVRHLLRWTLGSDCPVPLDRSEFWIWCQALDDDPGFDVTTSAKRNRAPPGKLADLCPEVPSPDLAAIRAAVGLRIASTPGCFYYRIDDTESQLEISAVRVPKHSEVLTREFAAARSGSDQLSDGRVLDVPVVDSVLFQTLGLGFARVIKSDRLRKPGGRHGASTTLSPVRYCQTVT